MKHAWSDLADFRDHIACRMTIAACHTRHYDGTVITGDMAIWTGTSKLT